MQAVVNSNIIKQDNIMEKLEYLLADVDNSTKNDVENSIVAMGAKVVNALVEKLRTLKGLQRGINHFSSTKFIINASKYAKINP